MNTTAENNSKNQLLNDNLSSNQTDSTGPKADIDLARIIALVLAVISLYILLALLYHSCKNGLCQNGSTARKLCLLIATSSLLVCVDKLAELWVNVISCQAYHILSTAVYAVGLGFVYTTLWIRQRRLYSDKMLKQTVNKLSRLASAVCIVIIYFLLISVFVSFAMVLKFEGSYSPCHIKRYNLAMLLPLLLFVIFSCFSLQLVLYILILYPLRRGKKIRAILCCSNSDDEVYLMLKRLAMCACACVLSTVFLCVAILLDTLEIICIYWGNLLALDLIISSLSTVVSFKDWDERLIPFFRRFKKKRHLPFRNSVIIHERSKSRGRIKPRQKRSPDLHRNFVN